MKFIAPMSSELHAVRSIERKWSLGDEDWKSKRRASDGCLLM